MSWLFDRLCELATADEVDVLIVADTSEQLSRDDANDLPDVLLRIAQIPQLAVCIVPPQPDEQRASRSAESIDLDRLDVASARLAIRTRLESVRGCSAALRITGGTASLGPIDRLWARDAGDGSTWVRRVFATDQAGHSDLFALAGPRGLGISIGGHDPQAAVTVPNMMGVISILDALVTLRQFAFGVTLVDDEIATSLCSSTQPTSLLGQQAVP